MYKDRAKQKEANRLAAKKYRDSKTGKGMTVVTPKSDIRVIPDTRLMTPIEAGKHVRMTVMEKLFYRPASELGRGETNFVSLPGRSCYGVY